MLTPEREKEIRGRLRYVGDQAEVNELFAEINRLRAENTRVIEHERNARNFLNEVRIERDELIEKINMIKEFTEQIIDIVGTKTGQASEWQERLRRIWDAFVI